MEKKREKKEEASVSCSSVLIGIRNCSTAAQKHVIYLQHVNFTLSPTQNSQAGYNITVIAIIFSYLVHSEFCKEKEKEKKKRSILWSRV